VNQVRTGAYRAYGAYGWVPVLVLAVACGRLPANREVQFASSEITKGVELKSSRVERTDSYKLLASDTLVASVELRDGDIIRFESVGYKSFGPNAVNIVISEADGLVPRIASCDAVSFPNFHRDAPLGHHFQPTLIDVNEAVRRSGEVLEEIQFWPQCPQSWEVQDKRAVNYRYCARRKDAADEPPRPESCGRD
jgi:hypothetical protein